MRNRKRNPRPKNGRASRPHSRRRRNALYFQGVVRQGQPLLSQSVSRPRPERRPPHSGQDQSRPEAADSQRHSRRSPGRRSSRSLRRPANSGLPVAANRSPGSRRKNRPRSEREKRPIPFPLGHDQRSRENRQRRQLQHRSDRARRLLRLPESSRRHSRLPHLAKTRLPGRLRRDPFGTTPRRPRPRQRRPTRIHRAASPRRSSGRRRRHLPRNPRQSQRRPFRRRKRPTAFAISGLVGP